MTVQPRENPSPQAPPVPRTPSAGDDSASATFSGSSSSAEGDASPMSPSAPATVIGGQLRRQLRSKAPALVGSLLLAGGCVWLLHVGSLPLLPPTDALVRVSWPGLVGYGVLIVLTLLVRAMRWQYLMLPIARVPLRQVVAINWVFFGANMALPLRLGEMARPILLAREGSVSLLQAFSMSAAERVIDGAVSSGLLLLTLALSHPLDPLPDRIGEMPIPASLVPTAGYSGCVLFGTALLVVYAFYRWRSLARQLSERLLSPLSPRLATRVAATLDALAEGLRFLSRGHSMLPFLAGTLGYWLCNGLSLWVVLQACGLEQVTLVQGFVLLGMLSLGLMVPGAPGYFGSFQFSVYASLALFIPPEAIMGTGAVAVFWMYTIQVLLVLACTLVGLVGLPPAARAKPAVTAA